MPRRRPRQAETLPINPPYQIGKRATRDQLEKAVANRLRSKESVVLLENEGRFADQKIGWIRAQADRPDKADREASASATIQLVFDAFRHDGRIGREVQGGGHKGTEKAHGTPRERWARRSAMWNWYRNKKIEMESANRRAVTDAEVLKTQLPHGILMLNGSFRRLSGRTLSRLKKEFR